MASIAAREATATSPIASARWNESASCSPVKSLNLRRCHRARSCRFWPIVASISGQGGASTGCCMLIAMPPARSGTATTGTKTSAKAQVDRPKPGVELGHHLPAHQRQGCVAVPLPGDRRLEPQCGGLGYRRTLRRSHLSGSGHKGLHPRADQQGP
jgi:hypothetical protein